MTCGVSLALLTMLLSGNPEGIQIGDKIPAFQATADSGETWKFEDHVGKKILVLYFYPADLTGGCTAQACAFRDHGPALKEAGVEVVGVSGDSVENHRIFKKAHSLNFTLLADEKGTLAQLFGVPTKAGGEIVRAVEGADVTLSRGVTASRWTFVIGPEGKVVYRNTNVKPAEDAEQVLEVIAKFKRKNADAENSGAK